MKTMLTAAAVVALLAMPAYADEPTKLTEAQMDNVSAGIIRLPRVPSLRDSGFSIPRLPRVGRVPTVDAIFGLRGLLGR